MKDAVSINNGIVPMFFILYLTEHVQELQEHYKADGEAIHIVSV